MEIIYIPLPRLRWPYSSLAKRHSIGDVVIILGICFVRNWKGTLEKAMALRLKGGETKSFVCLILFLLFAVLCCYYHYITPACALCLHMFPINFPFYFTSPLIYLSAKGFWGH